MTPDQSPDDPAAPWDLVEANLDFGTLAGYFIRLDIEMRTGESAPMPILGPAQARALAAELIDAAEKAEAMNARP